MRDRRAGRRRALAANHLGAAAPHVVQTMTGTSPPGPLRCGSTTCSVKAVATPASKALPPFSRIPMPTAVRDPMGRGDDPERAIDLGPGGERIGIDF